MKYIINNYVTNSKIISVKKLILLDIYAKCLNIFNLLTRNAFIPELIYLEIRFDDSKFVVTIIRHRRFFKLVCLSVRAHEMPGTE